MKKISRIGALKIISRLSEPLLTLLARLRRPFWTARLIGIHLRTIQRASTANPLTLLLLPKFGFTEDALASFGGKDNLTLHTLERRLVKAVYKGFLSETIDDNNYRVHDAGIQKNKSDLRLFWKRILVHLMQHHPIDAVLTGNFSYAAEQELAGACKELKIGFIAIHKECLKTPGLEPFYQEIYENRKNNFQGSKICVYNDIERRIEIAAGIAAREDILITGMPRLDHLHRYRNLMKGNDENRAKPPTVLFFLFNKKAGLPIIGRKLPQRFETLEEDLERLNVARLSRSCHLAMLELAQRCSDIEVIIKTKGDVQSAKTLDEFFGANPTFPDNFKIMAGGSLVDVIKQASVVCGFNSTALIEAVALNKAVVVPRFYEAADTHLEKFILDMRGVAQFAESEAELIELLANNARSETLRHEAFDLSEEQCAFLTKWLGNADGHAGDRVYKAVGRIITEIQQA